MAASMLMEKRLVGCIDQLNSRLHFEHKQANMDRANFDSADALRAFDSQITCTCRSVEGLAIMIAEKQSHLVAAY